MTSPGRPAGLPVAVPEAERVVPDVLLGGVPAEGSTSRTGVAALVLAAAGLFVSLGIGIGSVAGGLGLPGGIALAVGTLAALAGAYLCLALLVLVARVPWLEREVGHPRLVALHRRVAPYSVLLIALHVLMTTVGYAQAAETGVLPQLWTIVTTTAWMLPAATAFVLLVAVSVMSYRRVRSRMRYETWWVGHLYFYLAVAFSFGHQVTSGEMFVGNAPQRWFWISLYAGTAALILVNRVLLPVLRSRRHQLRIATVVPAGDGVVLVYVTGRDLAGMGARGGQFFEWRFLTREWWWQAHPYSLSATPDPSVLRLTVREVGDQSSSLVALAPGTRILAEGPYGVFTAGSRHGNRVVLVAAGIGISPIRGVLDELPPGADVTLVHRVPDRATAPLRDEIAVLCTSRGWRLHYLEGSRELHAITPELLGSLAPGIGRSDVFVCGPQSFSDSVVAAARAAGVPDLRIHRDDFRL